MRLFLTHRKKKKAFIRKSEKVEAIIEERLALQLINGSVQMHVTDWLLFLCKRDACGGCFNQIPPQRQLDIKSRKKIIVCEYCGRILVDDEIIKEGSL
jgi:uncharacterized protein